VNGPNLTTSNDTCMGSSSGSANGPGFGVSFGTTWTDEHCKRLKMSRELWNKGMRQPRWQWTAWIPPLAWHWRSRALNARNP
jgi:hypothetical protein